MQSRMLVPARVNPILFHPNERRVSLDGRFRFRLDPKDRGGSERWFERLDLLEDSIEVPGSWQGQGFGHEGTDRLWDFDLDVRVFRATYAGTAWYGKRFEVPGDWEGRRIWLAFGGVHPSAEVWVNGARVGENSLPFVPFGFEVTGLVRFGEDNALTVRVHERNRALGYVYNYQGNWSGLYRSVELVATGAVALTRCLIYPEVDRENMRIEVAADGAPAAPLLMRVETWPVADGSKRIRFERPLAGLTGHLGVPVPSPRLWSPEAPNLYGVDVSLLREGEVTDALSERVGFVELAAQGTQFTINGQPYYMRGTGDFLSCPETGCPDWNRDRWRKKLRTLREYGYNYVRCQSYVYGPEYFDVADETGLLVQSEMGVLGAWGGRDPYHLRYQWPLPTADLRADMKRQWDLVVERDVNHPSANLYCMSNEWGDYGKWGHGKSFHPHFAWKVYHETKKLKPTAMVIYTDGGYAPDLPGDFVSDYTTTRPEGITVPIIEHEYRGWSSYPDVRTWGKYTGAVRPYTLELAAKAASAHSVAHLLPLFAENSQRLQLLEAKANIEACRQDNPHLAGICHWEAPDLVAAPQGILDAFYDRKIIDRAEWLRINGDTVVMASLGAGIEGTLEPYNMGLILSRRGDDRIVAGGSVFRCTLSVSDFSHPPLKKPEVIWSIRDGNRVIASGRIIYEHAPFRTCTAGRIEAPFPREKEPRTLKLTASVREADRVFSNEWTLWSFPPSSSLPTGTAVYGAPRDTWLSRWPDLPSAGEDSLTRGGRYRAILTEILDDAVVAFLRAGGRVILTATEGMIRRWDGIHCFFAYPGQYPPYEGGQNGTVIIPHPMLGAFPHDGFADWQFFRLINEAFPIELEPFGLTRRDPIVRVIHRYNVCLPLGYLAEAAVGNGRLILTGFHFSPEWPEARYLLAQICAYACGDEVAEAPQLAEADVRSLREASGLTCWGPEAPCAERD